MSAGLSLNFGFPVGCLWQRRVSELVRVSGYVSGWLLMRIYNSVVYVHNDGQFDSPVGRPIAELWFARQFCVAGSATHSGWQAEKHGAVTDLQRYAMLRTLTPLSRCLPRLSRRCDPLRVSKADRFKGAADVQNGPRSTLRLTVPE